MSYRFLVPVLAVAAMVTANGCTQSIGGSAQRAAPGLEPGRSYGYVDDRCGLMDDASVQEVVGADDVVRPYSGAVCQYVLSRQLVMIDVTFSWFETGSLDRERALAVLRGAQIGDTVVERHRAFLARRTAGSDGTAAGCAATAAANPGVLSWSVHFRGQSAGDPCADAEQLLAATLSSDM